MRRITWLSRAKDQIAQFSRPKEGKQHTHTKEMAQTLDGSERGVFLQPAVTHRRAFWDDENRLDAFHKEFVVVPSGASEAELELRQTFESRKLDRLEFQKEVKESELTRLRFKTRTRKVSAQIRRKENEIRGLSREIANTRRRIQGLERARALVRGGRMRTRPGRRRY